MVMRIPAEFPAGDYDLMVVCYNDHDVSDRVRRTVFEVAGAPVSATAIGDVDPLVQPTYYCLPTFDRCRQLQPFPPDFPI
ncbi:MAG: hypothetical protein R2733_17625 [Acidimicrobiales bacterium]